MQQLRLGEAAVPVQRRKESGLTFGEAWAIFDEKWLPNLKRADMERKFYTTYLKPALGNKPLHMITPLELEDLKNSLLKKGLAPASVKLIVGNVRRVYNKMFEWDLYSGPKPMDKVKLPKVDKQMPSLKTDADAEAFVESADLSEYDLSGFSPVKFEFEAKSAALNMRLPQSLLDAVKIRAKEEGMPYTRYIRLVLEQAVNSRK